MLTRKIHLGGWSTSETKESRKKKILDIHRIMFTYFIDRGRYTAHTLYDNRELCKADGPTVKRTGALRRENYDYSF